MSNLDFIKKILHIIKQPAVIIDDKKVVLWNEHFANICHFQTTHSPRVFFSHLNPFIYIEDGSEVTFLNQNYILKKIKIAETPKQNNYYYCFILATSFSNEAFDDMLLAVGHELKTPLTKIRLATDLMKAKSKEKEIINRACSMLESTINSLMELGTIEFWWDNYAMVSIMDLQNSIKNKYLSSWEDKNIKYVFDNTKNKIEKVSIVGGIQILERIIFSLLDNSTKYVDKNDSIKVCISLEEKKLVCVIEDSGLGIQKKNLENIFVPFFSDNIKQKKNGVGLGLYIVKKLLYRLGGDIKIISHVNIGTSVTFTIPYNEVVF